METSSLRQWKRDIPGYRAIHTWVVRQLGQPLECWECDFTSSKSRDFNWANISQQYKKEAADWKRLCRSCHWKFDLPYRTNPSTKKLYTPEYCNRQHKQTITNIYLRKPRKHGHNIQVRCRTCRTEDMRRFKRQNGAIGASFGCP